MLVIIKKKFAAYMRLIRLDKPVGSLLLLWPTLWALCLSALKIPSFRIVLIFVLGVFFMRSAGCVVNDLADRKIDKYVKRTCKRPLTIGIISSKEAKIIFIIMMIISFGLVVTMNNKTIWLSLCGLPLVCIYPFMKRYTHLSQLVLGICFSWSIPMSWVAVTSRLPVNCWLLFIGNICWTIAYDTQYAMVDRDDDIKIGVKSTAILFGRFDNLIIGILQLAALGLIGLVGWRSQLGFIFYCSILLAAVLFIYQQQLTNQRDRDLCFKAFLNNNWVGLIIFVGILLSFNYW